MTETMQSSDVRSRLRRFNQCDSGPPTVELESHFRAGRDLHPGMQPLQSAEPPG